MVKRYTMPFGNQNMVNTDDSKIMSKARGSYIKGVCLSVAVPESSVSPEKTGAQVLGVHVQVSPQNHQVSISRGVTKGWKHTHTHSAAHR